NYSILIMAYVHMKMESSSDDDSDSDSEDFKLFMLNKEKILLSLRKLKDEMRAGERIDAELRRDLVFLLADEPILARMIEDRIRRGQAPGVDMSKTLKEIQDDLADKKALLRANQLKQRETRERIHQVCVEYQRIYGRESHIT
ncbi:hypothetical protein PFISCL1PPCAC_10270, partial [Pristionchus fissidentatus]